MEQSYAFGKNWLRFLRTLTPEKERLAAHSLQEFLGLDSLRRKTFVDIGCGSGLFSLAAFTLGAERVVSIDVDPFSVECCRYLHERAGGPGHWQVRKGSILDPDIADLGSFDVVYSWGVLHHTGRMWQAIDRAASLTAAGGLFFIAIYNTCHIRGFHPDGRLGTSRFWYREKKFYNAVPAFLQRCIDALAMAAAWLGYLARGRNPVRVMREHTQKFRGMDWATDIRDWLGGWPYEHATAQEVTAHVEKKGFQTLKVRTVDDLRNNEFLFRKA